MGDDGVGLMNVGALVLHFDSLYLAPKYLSNFYLSAYLDTLKNSGWSIFVVQGSLPSSAHWGNDGNVGRGGSALRGRSVSPVAGLRRKRQIEKSKTKSSEKESSSRIGSANLDADYASDIAASLANIQCPPTATPQSQSPDASSLAQALACPSTTQRIT